MTTITAKIITDSISPDKIRLTTFQLRYPRVIHAEFMTHRQFSRNASSSRAIPVERLIQDVLDDPYIPIHWGKNQKGMQAQEEHDASVVIRELDGDWPYERVDAWLWARDRAVEAARAFATANYHKQLTNRLLEPFAHINVVVTATEWSNFLAVRDHPDAMPEIQELARAIKAAMAASTPQLLSFGDWHLPYVNDKQGSLDSKLIWDYALKHDCDLMEVARRVSAARCARVSYVTHEGRTLSAFGFFLA